MRSPMMSFFMAGLLVQEIGLEVRSVDARVAARAGAPRLEAKAAVGHVIGDRIHVALQAQQALLAADQQHAVDAAVRSVASHTTLDL